MKALNKMLQVLAVAFSVAALILFFFPFAKFGFADGVKSASGLQLAFGAEVFGQNIAKSADILFCFLTAVISTALSIFTFFAKSNKVSYFASGFTFGTAVYMLVIALSNPWKFVDTRPFTSQIETGGLSYAPFVLIVALVLMVAAVLAIAYMLVNDYLIVLASKGNKQVLLKRILKFFKDYKSECTKIVWPGLKEVVKNTGIVLIMCLVIGALIWLVDWGLGSLLELIW